MRRHVTTVIIGMLLALYFVLFSPGISAARADADPEPVCYVLEVHLTNYGGATATATVYFVDTNTEDIISGSATITLNPGQSGTLRLAAFVPGDANVVPFGESDGEVTSDSYTFGPADPSACGGGDSGIAQISDGRINSHDLAAPLATYCSDGGITVWDISADGQGTLGFTATQQQIADALAAAKSSGQNQLIAEGLGNSLYALSSNELTLVGPDVKEPGKTYTTILPAGVCG